MAEYKEIALKFFDYPRKLMGLNPRRPFIPSIRKKYGIEHALPPSLELTTMIGCPLMCTFCPQDNLREAYSVEGNKYMSLETLKTVLQKIPEQTRVDFSGMAEPWANPRATEMLEMVLEEGFTIAIYTTLYGMTLKHAKIVSGLLEKHDAQIETFVLHLPDANGNMKGWKYSDEWDAVARIILDSKISCGIQSMTMDSAGDVDQKVSHIFNTKLPGFSGISRADSLNIDQIGEQKIRPIPRHSKSITCASSPFYDRNTLLPNGDVVLCCMDYNLKHIIGNLLTQNYADIFRTKQFKALMQINESADYSKCSICKSCENVSFI